MAASHATVSNTDHTSEVNNQLLKKINNACIQSTQLKSEEFFVVAIQHNAKGIRSAFIAKATKEPSMIMAPLPHQTGEARLRWAKATNQLMSTLNLEHVYLKSQKDLYLRPAEDTPKGISVPNWYMVDTSCTVVSEMGSEPFWLDINSFVEIE